MLQCKLHSLLFSEKLILIHELKRNLRKGLFYINKLILAIPSSFGKKKKILEKISAIQNSILSYKNSTIVPNKTVKSDIFTDI